MAVPITEEQLVANARGLAAAALLPPDIIAKLFGRSIEDATALHEQAMTDWLRLQRAGQQAKGKPS